MQKGQAVLVCPPLNIREEVRPGSNAAYMQPCVSFSPFSMVTYYHGKTVRRCSTSVQLTVITHSFYSHITVKPSSTTQHPRIYYTSDRHAVLTRVTKSPHLEAFKCTINN